LKTDLYIYKPKLSSTHYIN